MRAKKKSTITSKKIKFIEIPSDADLSGTKVYEGSAACDGADGSPYTVKVKVTTINGVISKIEDNGTEDTITSESDYAFWYGHGVMESDGMPSKLKGKNLRQIINAKTTPYAEDESYAADAVSGATVSSNSVKYAVINALISSPVSESENTVSAPTVSAYESGFVVLNALNKKMNAVITGNEDTTIRYTLDGTEPTAESAEIGKIGYFGDKDGVAFEAEPEKYPDGRIICLKVAAFKDGEKSDTVTKYFVFANTNSTHSYEVGSYTGKSGSTSVNVTVEDPSYSGKCLITNIQLDDESKKKYSAFADEFLSRIYLKQDTVGVIVVEGHEKECNEILAAVKTALDNAYLPSKPTITLSEEKNSYENSDLVGITFATPTDDAEIYYTVDNSNTMSGSTLSDPTKTGTKYEGTFNVNIENISGGKLYIRAAAKKDRKWSSTVRKDLTFLKGVKENAFVVNGTNYSKWDDAVNAVNSLENGGTIVLNDDVELSNESVMPTKPCTIKSADGNAYKVKANILNAQADITFDGITYDISRIYAGGHSVAVKSSVKSGYSFLGRYIYAGLAKEDCMAQNSVITVEKGDFKIYTGNLSGNFTGNVTVNVSGSDEQTKVNLNGTGVSTTTDGNVTFNVDGGNKAVYIGGFLGEVSGGNITGTLTLNITGNPELSSYGTYKASVDKDAFGVLNLTGADSDFVSANQDKFTKFAEIKGGASTAADTAEILSLEEAADEEKEVYGPVVLPIYNEETPVAGIE